MASWRLRLFITVACLVLLSNAWLCAADDDEEDEDVIIYKTVVQRKLVTATPTARSILKEHDKPATATTTRSFPGVTLGYVTPWNRHGYEIAKKFHCKLDIVSPVWFQLATKGGKVAINGEHDIDAKWMAEVRSQPACPHRLKRDTTGGSFGRTQIVPRIIIDGWSSEDFDNLFNPSHPLGADVIKAALAFVKKHNFDGIVLDAGYISFRLPHRDAIIGFVSQLGDALRAESRLFVLVVPPYRGGELEKTSFNAADFQDLRAHVDYFSLMTYDFGNNQNSASNSPLSWFEGCHVTITKNRDETHQILGGVNLYGNDYAIGRSSGGPVIGHEILKLLASKKPKIVWNTEAAEHSFQYNQDGVEHIVWFPTLNYIHQRVQTATSTLSSGLSFWELGQGMDYFYDLL